MYKQEFPDIPIGYSGHELGTAISVAAVAMGADVSSLHFV
jgi:sialic acid synthase SpsE